METQSLFPAPVDGEKTWTIDLPIPGGQSLAIPMYQSLVDGELRDQITLKSSVRKAALRSSQKMISRLAKRGADKLAADQLEELKWSMFICHVDQVIAGKHLALRDDEAAVKKLATDAAFSG